MISINDNIEKIDPNRTDLKINDLKDHEILLLLKMELSFNPITQRWDGENLNNDYIKYFINENGVLSIPLGNLNVVDLNDSGLKSVHNLPTSANVLNLHNNKLSSLEGIPLTNINTLDLSCNSIETLEYLPNYNLDILDLSNNKLASLENCPYIRSNLMINNNPIRSLKGLKKINYENNYKINGNILIKNYCFNKASHLNIKSLYKISNIETLYGKSLINTNQNNHKSEDEYYIGLAEYMIRNKLTHRVNEIWWNDNIIDKVKHMFKSCKSIEKFNL